MSSVLNANDGGRTPKSARLDKLVVLDEAHKLMYKSERGENFRWIAHILKSTSKNTLSSDDRCDADLQATIAAWGEFAELAHGSYAPTFIWNNLLALTKEGYPLEKYTYLTGSSFVREFHGHGIGSVQGYVVNRTEQNEIVVAFSGTSSPMQALYDMCFFKISHPDGKRAGVHAGFWHLYHRVRSAAFEALLSALKDIRGSRRLVITGHSMGGAMAYLFALDILRSPNRSLFQNSEITAMVDSLTVVTFGCPRIGNAAFVSHYKKSVEYFERPYTEYSIRGFDDGVPCLPPKAWNYRHVCDTPLYLFHGRLYNIPSGDQECSHFEVTDDATGDDNRPEFPKGGHNYYYHDMEKLQRGIKALKLNVLGEAGWEQRLKEYLRKK